MFIRTIALCLASAASLTACASVVSPAAVAASAATQPAVSFASDRISVTTQGSGPDVILIPGLSSSPRVWASTVAAVPGYRYHLVQVKGFAGVPAEANGSGSVAAPVAAEIARYIQAARLAKPAVVGHSMGGTIGMMLAARNPDAVGRLMVVDMMPFMGAMFGGPGATADSVRPVAEQIRAAISGPVTPAGEKMLEATMTGMIRTESERPAALADSRASDRATSGNSYYELVTTDLTSELARIAVPVRVLYVTPTGAPLSDAQMDGFYRAAYRNVPNATLTRIPDSAHFIMFDQPARFRQELKDFLTG
ncbi:MAG TPA: alpha/beta hydrolase [Sphingomonadaceae bacterium]|nr:alpha/beta hydrolase [Sphingomonadaceae bacterium]